MINLTERLTKPSEVVDVVLDTDTYNEIDDQFALAYLIKKEKRLNLKALYAAPFYNDHSENPADGMEKSYDEILNVLELMERKDLFNIVYKGSTHFLNDEKSPVISDASTDLSTRAMNYTPDNPLYVIAIGAITNVASAILQNPSIIDRIVIVWLGGNAHHLSDNREFNLCQDVAAARIIFGCGAAVVQLPCVGVVSTFLTTGPELRYWLGGKNPLCDYLINTTEQEALRTGDSPCWSRIIWDVTAVAWLLDDKFMSDRLVPSPIPQYDHHYSFDEGRHPIRYVYNINRDVLFEDLFKTLAE